MRPWPPLFTHVQNEVYPAPCKSRPGMVVGGTFPPAPSAAPLPDVAADTVSQCGSTSHPTSAAPVSVSVSASASTTATACGTVVHRAAQPDTDAGSAAGSAPAATQDKGDPAPAVRKTVALEVMLLFMAAAVVHDMMLAKYVEAPRRRVCIGAFIGVGLLLAVVSDQNTRAGIGKTGLGYLLLLGGLLSVPWLAPWVAQRSPRVVCAVSGVVATMAGIATLACTRSAVMTVVAVLWSIGAPLWLTWDTMVQTYAKDPDTDPDALVAEAYLGDKGFTVRDEQDQDPPKSGPTLVDVVRKLCGKQRKGSA